MEAIGRRTFFVVKLNKGGLLSLKQKIVVVGALIIFKKYDWCRKKFRNSKNIFKEILILRRYIYAWRSWKHNIPYVYRPARFSKRLSFCSLLSLGLGVVECTPAVKSSLSSPLGCLLKALLWSCLYLLCIQRSTIFTVRIFFWANSFEWQPPTARNLKLWPPIVEKPKNGKYHIQHTGIFKR